MAQRTLSRPLLAAVVGFAMGLALGGGSMIGDFVRRLHWSLTGGGGESADWGEPLFYLVLMGVPLGLVVGTVAFVIGVIVEWLASRQEK